MTQQEEIDKLENEKRQAQQEIIMDVVKKYPVAMNWFYRTCDGFHTSKEVDQVIGDVITGHAISFKKLSEICFAVHLKISFEGGDVLEVAKIAGKLSDIGLSVIESSDFIVKGIMSKVLQG